MLSIRVEKIDNAWLLSWGSGGAVYGRMAALTIPEIRRKILELVDGIAAPEDLDRALTVARSVSRAS